MRFLFCDQIVEFEPGIRARATKMVSMSEEFLPEHYPRQPVMPATLVLECIAQLAGWLYVVTEHFGISTVLGLAQEVSIYKLVHPGDRLNLEVWLTYVHKGGATMRGEVRCDGELVLRAERLMFASRQNPSQIEIAQARELFRYMSRGLELASERRL